LFVFPVFVFAELEPSAGWYVRFDTGFSSARDPELTVPDGPIPGDLGTSAVFGGGIGYSYVAGLRGDVTLTYRSGFEQVSGFSPMPEGRAEFQSLTTLLSLYLDLYTTARVSPYGGCGLGFSRNKLGKTTITNPDGSLLGTIDGKSKTSFAWQLCGGAAVQLGNRLLLDIGYHLVSGGDYESEELLRFPDGSSEPRKDTGKFHSHEVLVSFQYTF
jgi:opacity protein-like surface antigen